MYGRRRDSVAAGFAVRDGRPCVCVDGALRSPAGGEYLFSEEAPDPEIQNAFYPLVSVRFREGIQRFKRSIRPVRRDEIQHPAELRQWVVLRGFNFCIIALDGNGLWHVGLRVCEIGRAHV